MEKVYYTSMQKALALPTALLLLTSTLSAQQPQQPTPIRASALDSHEGMTIGARPLTSPDQYKPSFPKKNPFSYGILAIHVTFRNDTADSIRVNIARIRLSLSLEDDSRQELPALASED